MWLNSRVELTNLPVEPIVEKNMTRCYLAVPSEVKAGTKPCTELTVTFVRNEESGKPLQGGGTSAYS